MADSPSLFTFDSFFPTYKNLKFSKHVVFKGINNFEDIKILVGTLEAREMGWGSRMKIDGGGSGWVQFQFQGCSLGSLLDPIIPSHLPPNPSLFPLPTPLLSSYSQSIV